MLNTEPMYNLRDISIIPAEISNIKSRSECRPFYYLNGQYNMEKTLPVFASPMSSVVNLENLQLWEKNNIIPIIPRNIPFEDRLKQGFENSRWFAVSLSEFNKLFIDEDMIVNKYISENKTGIKLTINVLIDVANGHMEHIYDSCLHAKVYAHKHNINLHIMVGNIANPETVGYIIDHNDLYGDMIGFSNTYSNKVIDYVRVGIGGGNCCTTSSSVKVHMAMGTLLDEIHKKYGDKVACPEIIADGGIRTYSDAITALALGANYVMIGTTFGSLYESAADFVNFYIDDRDRELFYDPSDEAEIRRRKVISDIITDIHPIYKKVHGMSTYVAQKEIDKNAKLRLTEGLGREVRCYKTIGQWSEEFSGYLRSCMSYCGMNTINNFIGKVQCRVLSPNAVNGFNNSIDNYVGKELYVIKEN